MAETIFSGSKCARAMLIGLLLCLAPDLWAHTHDSEEEPPPLRATERTWDISFYRGKYTRTNLGQILLAGRTRYEASYISVLTLGRPLATRLWRADLEGEGQLVHHTGVQKHLEFNGLVMARITEPFRGTPFSVAIGEGLSLATRNPDLENPRRSISRPDLRTETSRNLLNYLVFELEMAVPFDYYRPRAFVRVHHRSGIFGTLCPSICGSNFVAYGVRFAY